MRAVESRYAILAFNEKILSAITDKAHRHHHALDEWSLTSGMLREADTYCWFTDPEIAVQAADGNPATGLYPRSRGHPLEGRVLVLRATDRRPDGR